MLEIKMSAFGRFFIFLDLHQGVMFEKMEYLVAVSYTHLRAHETVIDLVCRLLLEKKKQARHAPPS